MSSEKSNSVWGIVAKAALGPVVAAIVAAVSPPFLAFLKMLWSNVVGGWLWLDEEHMVSGWLITFMSVGTAGLLIVLALALHQHLTEKSAQSDLWWKSFKEMDFNGATWRWSWSSDNEIKNLAPYCSRCDGLLVYEEPSHDLLYGYEGNQVKLFCENCSYRLVSSIISDRYSNAVLVVKREIYRRVRVESKARNQVVSH